MILGKSAFNDPKPRIKRTGGAKPGSLGKFLFTDLPLSSSRSSRPRPLAIFWGDFGGNIIPCPEVKLGDALVKMDGGETECWKILAMGIPLEWSA